MGHKLEWPRTSVRGHNVVDLLASLIDHNFNRCEAEPQVIRDGNGRLIGTVRERSDFGFEARTSTGINLGRFNTEEHAARALLTRRAA